MRAAFSDTLVRLAKEDPNVLLLTGDHGYALFDDFRKHCPAQYINAGIAEQNMVGMAAGLARQGFRPIVYGLSAFIPVRVVEQVKLDVAHDGLPVIFIGDGAGFVYSHLGTSHQSTEDIACARAIPDLAVFSPADRVEIAACLELAYLRKAPVYLRMGKSDRGDVHSSPKAIPGKDVRAIGSLVRVAEGLPAQREVALIATGSMVKTALNIATRRFPEIPVWSVPFIKPIDVDHVASLCAQYRSLVVLEEHSVMGGLGSLVSEIAAERAPTRILRIGVQDRFSLHCGTYDYLLKEHGLDEETVASSIRQFRDALQK